MSKRDSSVPLRHMLDHAREVISLVVGRSRSDLDSDRMLNLSLVRLLEVIGEAARRVPAEVQARHPQLPWARLIGLRNRLIHGYDQVDMDILWQIASADAPALLDQIEAVLAQEGTGE